MAFLGRRRGDITIHGINDGDQFSVRWHRLLFPFDGLPAVHFGPLQLVPATPFNVQSAVDGRSEPTFSAPIDADTPLPGGQDAGVPGSVANSSDGTPAPQIENVAASPDDQALFWHPPYFAPNPISEATIDPVTASGDSAPPAGHIPKSDAIIWSGPAVMAFPGEPHDTSGDAAAPGGGDTADAPDAPDVAETPDTPGAPDVADTPDAPDVADAPDILTRADLVPVLAAMGSGGDHAPAPDAGGGDLSAAFLPPDSNDSGGLGHGLDLGFAFTPPPLPPPPPGVF